MIVGAVTAASALLLLHYLRARAAPRLARETPARGKKTPPPPRNSAPDVQLAIDGAGPLRHRRYTVQVETHTHSAPGLLHAIQRHLTELSPASLAEFAKTVGDPWRMQPGDEYEISMLGPWNGRVRVADMTPNTFTLVTCEGHPEAGHIVFGVRNDALRVHTMQIEINSYARSRDATVELAYTTLHVGEQVQAEVWITFLQRVAALSGMTRVPEVGITTEELVD
jgi:hypothetical protein